MQLEAKRKPRRLGKIRDKNINKRFCMKEEYFSKIIEEGFREVV